MFDSVIAFSLRLHSSSCTYLPDEIPTDISCKPPDNDFRQDCCPLLIKLGLIAVDTGIDLEPAPLYVLLTFPLLELDVLRSPSILVPSPSSSPSKSGSYSPSSLAGGGSISGAGSICAKAKLGASSKTNKSCFIKQLYSPVLR